MSTVGRLALVVSTGWGWVGFAGAGADGSGNDGLVVSLTFVGALRNSTWEGGCRWMELSDVGTLCVGWVGLSVAMSLSWGWIGVSAGW